MKLLSIVAFFLLLKSSVSAQDFYMFIGTYNSPKSEGIYVYKFNSNDGSVKQVSHIKISNPSYIVVSPGEKYVYSVQEDGNNNGGGNITAFSFDKTSGLLSFINTQPSGGDHPCYVETDKTGRWVFAGNYSSGTVSVLPVLANGGLGTAVTTIQHNGAGSNQQRQSSPHVHATVISSDNKWLFTPDLGIDKVMIYSFSDKNGSLSPAKQPYTASKPGAGPRHFTFHPTNKFAYLIEELSGNIVTYNYKKGKLKPVQVISNMVTGDTSFPGSADIHVSHDGKFLYASNRSTVNNIGIFSINPKNGKLRLAGHQPTLGKGPRNFNIDPTGKFLIVANQNSDQVVIFERNLHTGLLKDTGQRIEVGKPVCIKWMKIN